MPEALILDTEFVITEIAHPGLRDWKPNCADCLALYSEAVTWARVTGSKGSTVGKSGTTPSPEDHSITILRAILPPPF